MALIYLCLTYHSPKPTLYTLHYRAEHYKPEFRKPWKS